MCIRDSIETERQRQRQGHYSYTQHEAAVRVKHSHAEYSDRAFCPRKRSVLSSSCSAYSSQNATKKKLNAASCSLKLYLLQCVNSTLLPVSCHSQAASGFSAQPASSSQSREVLSKAENSFQFIVQELCESRGGRPGLSVLTSLLVSVDVNHGSSEWGQCSTKNY